MNSTSRSLCSLTALCAALGAGAAVAHNPVGGEQAGELAVLADHSNLVFTGRVAKVDYQNLKSDGGEEGIIPHTFVTYQIDSVLRGRAPGKTFTMVFIGGTDGMGGFLEVSGVPAFEVGERDLLFVEGNGEAACPLVLCEYGRFRIHENGVFNTHGSPVRGVIDDNVVARGEAPRAFRTFSYPAPKFDDLMRNPAVKDQLATQGMSMEEARKRYDAEAPKQITLDVVMPESVEKPDSAAADGGKPAPGRRQLQQLQREQLKSGQLDQPKGAVLQRAPATAARPDASQIAPRLDPSLAVATTQDDLPEGPMAIEEFAGHVRAVLSKTQRKAADLKSVSLQNKIRLVSPTMRQAVAVDPGIVATASQTDADKREVELLQQQGFNPVLKQ